MYAFYMSVTLTNVTLRNALQHNYSSVLVHVSCCGNKEENGKCTCEFLVQLLLDLQDQHNTRSPEHAENNIQELCDEAEGRELRGVHPTSITPILSTITS